MSDLRLLRCLRPIRFYTSQATTVVLVESANHPDAAVTSVCSCFSGAVDYGRRYRLRRAHVRHRVAFSGIYHRSVRQLVCI